MRVVSRALCPPVVPALLSRIVWSAVLLGCAWASGTVWAADAPAAAKAADKPASKAADKAHDKHADKSADKPAEKSADKPVERSADRAAEKAAEKPADKTAPPATPAPAPARASAQDPLDRLRDALEARLGATPGKPYPGATPAATVQVAARAPGEFQVTAGRPSAAAAHGGSRAAKRAAPAAHPPGAEHHPHWSYAGETGPDQWAKLKPEFNLCAIGQRQSPIDIRDGFPVEHEPVVFEYRPGGFTVVNNGHTLQANVEAGNRILVGGRSYELVQFHFHHPAEERINGRGFAMVAHLVHKSADGRLAVVAVLLERGAPQSVVQTVWNHLPLEINQPVTGRVPLDPTELLPPDRRYYTYMGSLTTPPCTEGVLWVVLKQPVGVSVQQVQFFSRLYPMNARPLQNAAGRVIKQSQ